MKNKIKINKMNFSYNNGKIYGKDINEARYNALLETFYNYYPNLSRKVKMGRNYFKKDANTAQLLERRVLGEDVYIPDEDEDILSKLVSAYKTTKYDFQACRTQKDEKSCESLKFRGSNRCVYEKKWLSIIRGGTCVIDQKLVEHLVNNLQPFIDIKWHSLKAKPLRNSDPNLPNPDEFTKEDIVNLIHDLGYHISPLFGGKDLTSILEGKTGKNILDLNIQELLYYLYLFSYIIYASQYLDMKEFEKMLTLDNFKELNNLISQPPAKNNLINFIVGFNSKVPKSEKGAFLTHGWGYGALIGPILVLLLFALIPTAEAAHGFFDARAWKQYRAEKAFYRREEEQEPAIQKYLRNYDFSWLSIKNPFGEGMSIETYRKIEPYLRMAINMFRLKERKRE